MALGVVASGFFLRYNEPWLITPFSGRAPSSGEQSPAFFSNPRKGL